MTSSLRPALITAAAFLLVAVNACSGGGSPGRPGASDDFPAEITGAAMPAPDELDALRAVAGMTDAPIAGKDAFLRSPGAEEDGTELTLNARTDGPNGGESQWAIYAFNPQGGIIDRVSVLLQTTTDEEAWIGLANYSKGSWQWAGPYKSAHTVLLDEDDYLSPSGNFYCAVYSHSGNAAFVSGLTVRYLGPDNAPPVAEFSLDQSEGDAPLVVNFDASGSADAEGAIFEYAWDWEGDGSFDDFSAGPQITHVFSTAGIYDVRLRVSDQLLVTDTTELTVTVTVAGNIAPSAVLQALPPFVTEGSVVTLDGLLSDDPDGYITKYEFDFDGDGFYESTSFLGVAGGLYGQHGVYRARMRITDLVGEQAVASTLVRVNEALTVEAPWPARGRDLRHTGRSPYAGAQSSHIRWAFTALSDVRSSPAVAGDGTVYAGSLDGNLYAVSQDGAKLWEFPTGGPIQSSPTIGPGGVIYVGSVDCNLYAINPDGTLRWSFPAVDDVNSSPTIGPDGTIYVGSYGGNLYAINPDGSLKWAFPVPIGVYSSPALGPDGTIYFGGIDKQVYALNPDGSLKWSYATGGDIYCSPAIGPDGSVYIGSQNNTFYALKPDGTFWWSFTTSDLVYSSPAIAKDGTIYLGSWDNKVYALNPDSSLKWSFETDGPVESSPAIGADGVIYFGSNDSRVYALKPDGSLLWAQTTGLYVRSSPAIGPDGSVYIGSDDNKLYSFRDTTTDIPVAELTVDVDRPLTGETVTFDASDSVDPGGSIVAYMWDFDGDGAFDAIGPEATIDHSYPAQDTYMAEVRIITDEAEEATASLPITVVHTPWSGFGHDPQHGHRSAYTSAQSNSVAWDYSCGNMVRSSPALATDGTVYVGSFDGKLHAVNPDGSFKWSFDMGGAVFSSPAVAADGTIYSGSFDGNLYAVDPDGNLDWAFPTGGPVQSSPAIAADGTVFVGSDDFKVYAVSPGGTQVWAFPTGAEVRSSPAVSADGTVYVGSDDAKLYALSPAGTKDWSYQTGELIRSSPAVGADGTIYFGSTKLFAMNPDGTVKWSRIESNSVQSSPAIGADGTIYVGCADHSFYAFFPDGTFRWSFPMGSYIFSSAAIGADGTIYVGCLDNSIYALTPEGDLKWSFVSSDPVHSSPAIGQNNLLYIGSDNGKLYAFGAP